MEERPKTVDEDHLFLVDDSEVRPVSSQLYHISVKIMDKAGLNNVISATIPETVTSIGVSDFRVCFSMTSITIPENVISIDNEAFLACEGLKYVYCNATTPPELGSRAFDL